MKKTITILGLLVPITAVALPLFMLGGGLVTKFYAPFTNSGITPAAVASWPTAAGPAPTYAWWGDDPTGSQGKTTGTYTATGSPTTGIDTPFCPAGGFSDVSGCMQAVRFSGAGQYYTADSASTMQTTDNTDFSVCVVARVESGVTASRILAGNGRTASTANPGWTLYVYNGSIMRLSVYGGDTGGYVSATADTGSWFVLCGTYDADGRITSYLNGTASADGASPTIDAGSSTAVIIGMDYSAFTPFEGDIVAIFMWPTTALSAAQVKQVSHYFLGITDTKGSIATFFNTGPTSCWVDGMIESYSDNYAKLGCEIPPGLPGAGYPASGYMTSLTQTNSILQAMALDTTWTPTGVGVTGAGVNLPFRDARTANNKVTDDDAGSVEKISQTMAWAAAATNDKLQICIYAWADSAQNVDIQITEATVCGGSTANFASAAVGTSPAFVGPNSGGWTHTVADGTCTDFTLTICPSADCTAVAGQGHGYYLVEVYKLITYCPANPIITTTTAVAAGSDALLYNIAASGIVDAGGNFVGNTEYTFSWTPMMADLPLGTYPLVADSGADGERWYFLAQSNEKIRLAWDAGGVGTTADSAARTWTPGTWTAYKYVANYNTDSYILTEGTSAIITNTTARVSPTGITTMRVGQSRAGVAQAPGGAFIKELKVRK